MARPPNINIRKLSKASTIVLTVKVTREFKARRFIAIQLVKLAAWVLGSKSEIIKENNVN